MTLRPSHVLHIVLAAAAWGFVVFGILAARVTSVGQVDGTDAKGDRLLVWAE